MREKLKQVYILFFFVIVVVLSIMALWSDDAIDHNEGYTSAELSIRENIDGNVTSTSYVNSDGKITKAIDMGYATAPR